MSKYHLHNKNDSCAHGLSSVVNHKSHGHNHNHNLEDLQSKSIFLLKVVMILTFLFAIVEAVGGYLFNSLALMSDAAHMFTDSSSLLIAVVMAYIAKLPADKNHSYGHGRAEVLGALFNAIFMVGIIIMIGWQAIVRFNNPVEVKSMEMVIVASVGLIINIGAFFVLSKGSENLNIKAAWLHVLGDLLGSVAAIVAGIVIYYTGLNIIDPILSLLIALILIPSTISVLRKSVHILAEGVPHEIEFDEVGKELEKIEEFDEIHDLHIWSLDSKSLALSAHVTIKDMEKWQIGLKKAQKLLIEKYKIVHVTIQPEIK